MRFVKYQGLGNDFVVVEVTDPSVISPDQAKEICDRHFGVGADGVLLVSPDQTALARMTVLNADGSTPEMCGNGLRCVALHLSAREQAGDTFTVATGAGLLECQVGRRANQPWVDLSLGVARLESSFELTLPVGTLSFQRVSMGNPHAVTFDRQPSLAQIDVLGPEVSRLSPHGSNVEFVRQLGPAELDVVVWERGVGRTMACGTGAGAVAAAAAKAGRVPFDTPLTIHLPGGALEIRVGQADLLIHLGGPATRVFEGSID